MTRAVATLASLPEHAALFGSYDADPAARATVSRFRNLLHHYMHQIGRRETDTFWSGFGLDPKSRSTSVVLDCNARFV